ncbi:hypothetical protein EHM82_03095 [bacterium]|nr:MAG: hypothetical protein EHM82_03095 [bacterium]
MKRLPRLLAAFALLALAVPVWAQPPIDVRPRQPDPQEEIEVHLSGFEEGCPPVFHLESVENGVIVLRGFIIQTLVPCPPAPWTDTVVVPPLPPGSYRIEARIGEPSSGTDVLHAVTSIEVEPRSETLSLHDGSFVASIGWRTPGALGFEAGFAKALTSESGWFWFFSPDNLEVTLKVLDGRPVNDHWWIFVASMTNVEFKVVVHDNRTGCLALPVVPPACPTWTYTNPPFVNANRLDTRAFPAEQ